MKKNFHNILLLLVLILCVLSIISCTKNENEPKEKELIFLDNTTQYFAPVIPGVPIGEIIIPAFTKDNFTIYGDPFLLNVVGENISDLDFSLKKNRHMGAVTNPNNKQEIYDIYHFELSFITNSEYKFSEQERSVSSIKMSYVDKEYEIPIDITLKDIRIADSVGGTYALTDGLSLSYINNFSTATMQLNWQPDSWDYSTGGYCKLKNVFFAHETFDIDIEVFKMKYGYGHPKEVEFYYLDITCLRDMDYQHSNEMHIIEANLNQKNDIPYTGDYLKIEFQPYDHEESVTIVQRMYTKMDIKLMTKIIEEYLTKNK